MALSKYSTVELGTDETRLSQVRTRWIGILLASTALGSLAGLCGLVLSTASLIFTDTVKGLGSIGTVLLVAFFPLLGIAAHSLDKIRKAEKGLRLAKCRKDGLDV